MIVVMDQMQPSYAEQVRHGRTCCGCRTTGVNFPNAWVGDMASETVVSHNVMVSGLFPEHMGWSDEAIRDVDNILGYGDERHRHGRRPRDYADYVKLIKAMELPEARRLPARRVPGQHRRQRRREGLPGRVHGRLELGLLGPHGQQEEHRRSDHPFSPASVPWIGTYRGAGGNAPSVHHERPRYLVSVGNDLSASPRRCRTTTTAPRPTSRPGCIRKTVATSPSPYRPTSAATHGSPTPRSTSSTQPGDHGRTKDWSGLSITFSAIDKIGHMWGGGAVDTLANYTWTPGTLFEQVHMPWAAKTADDQLGRVIDALKAKGEFDDTLIVVTADHGVHLRRQGRLRRQTCTTAATSAAGTPARGSRLHHADACPTRPTVRLLLKPLMDTGKSSSATSPSPSSRGSRWTAAAGPTGSPWRRVMKTLPGVIATYVQATATTTCCSPTDQADDRLRVHLVEADRAASRRHHGVRRLGGRRRPARQQDRATRSTATTAARRRTCSASRCRSTPRASSTRRPPLNGMQLVDIMPTILRTMGIRQLAPDGRAAHNLGL